MEQCNIWCVEPSRSFRGHNSHPRATAFVHACSYVFFPPINFSNFSKWKAMTCTPNIKIIDHLVRLTAKYHCTCLSRLLIEKQYRALGKGARVRLIMWFFMRITDANEELLEELFCSVDDKIIRILISIPRPVIYKIYYTLAKYAKSSKTSPITRIFSEKNNNQTLILRRFYNG